MGAETFRVRAEGKHATEAFQNARAAAQYEHGHGGYTGTIAEKHQYIEVRLPAGADPIEYSDKLINAGDERIDDKWGPAGCIKLDDNEFLFFGWASS